MAADTGDTLTAISQWAYPFPQKDASAAIDPDAYLAALQGSDGPFPLGLNGLWHGGIHFDQEGGSSVSGDLDHSGGVRCIADGEVVAYCLDSDYQRLTYPDQSTALYSRSFTLVRHKLTLPPVPAGTSNSASNTPASSNKPSTDPADSLVFFSLYMHLAPCKVYKHSEQDKNKKTWPGYYNAESIYTVKSTYTVNAKDALDQQENVKSGEPIKGIHVHRDKRGHPEKNLGILPSGSKVKIQRPARAPKGWGRIEAIVSGEIAPITPGGTVEADASKGWVYLAAFDDEINPAALDKAYVLPKPIRIGAGEVIGYLGEYQNVQHASTLPPSPQRALLHVEVFAGDDLPTFMTRSVARAAQLTQEPKTQLVLEKGAVLYGYKAEGDLTLPEKTVVTPTKDSPERGAWAKVQIKGSADTTSYWIQRSELDGKGTRKAWREFPLSTANAPAGTNDYLRVVNIGGLVEFVDDKKHSWYQVDAGDAEQKTVNGFVCASGQAHVSLQNKWAWAGFKLLSSNLSTADLYKRFLHLKNDNGTAEEKAAFEASFNSAKSDALVTQLDEALMSAEHRQGKVLGEDVLSALRDKWRANRVDHLVVKYESEWGGQMSKWDALDPLMHDGLLYWKVEKDRIKQLQVWDACKGALKPLSGPSVYHLHPVGLVGNFLNLDVCACGCCLPVQCTRFHHTKDDIWYGPIHNGTIPLGNCPALKAMRTKGTLSETEEKILRAMSKNEGSVDTVQSIDTAIISAGAMQKTIMGKELGQGELAVQISTFKDQHPDEYQRLFLNCGWSISGAGAAAVLWYTHPTFTSGTQITGSELYAAVRRDCSADTFGKPISCPPVASLAHAISSPLYQELQVHDFIDRLNQAINKSLDGYAYPIKDYLQSPLGRATVLDQDVNYPGATSRSLKASLDRFFKANPAASKDPAEWGGNRAAYETSILQDYGPSRSMAKVNGLMVSPTRYATLVKDLGMPS
ncbi:hypothetical protein [Burkholderia gladioli]|uniref:hypothetical protein n=1 Tax=Burkholderia gladioli TaxID=28095 RepID=UPI0016414714|nr:hypothetical protein [Burkholderia gladioli]